MFQVVAVFLLAITGAIIAIEKKYDFSGVLVLAFVAGASGAIIRDGIFLAKVPVMVEQWEYLVAIAIAAVFTVIFVNYIKKVTTFFVIIDALGLGMFGMIAAQMAINDNLNVIAAVFIGLVAAVSGGFLRDILTKSEPLLLIPGQYYITAALAGIGLFIVLSAYTDLTAQASAILGIVLVLAIRIISHAFNIQTSPAINISEKIFKRGKKK